MEGARSEYCEGHTYNFCSDNCHCFVALALNSMEYGGRRCVNVPLRQCPCPHNLHVLEKLTATFRQLII